MGEKSARIDAYIRRAAPFAQPILRAARTAVHEACPGVGEEVKWSHAHFTYKGMFCGLAAFKAHVVFMFWKHKLLAGTRSPLTAAQKRLLEKLGRITTVEELPPKRALVALVRAAARLNDAGVSVPRAKRAAARPVADPPWLLAALRRTRGALAQYRAMTPGRRREYVEWLTEAKTEATRDKRLATAVAWIAEGKSRNWKYERC